MSTSSRAGKVFFNLAVPLFALAALAGAFALRRNDRPAPIPEAPARVVRIGYFPNFTHAQAVAGAERGDFVKALDGVKVEFKTFNAGPSLIEALFAGEIDLGYVGPSPTVNAYSKSNGEEIRVIAGSAANGVAVVVRPGANIEKPEDLLGKKIATPQYGNTQDVAARFFITQTLKGKLADAGGDTTIVNAENPDILTLLRKGDIDAAWVPEPWGTRLVAEAGGKILFEEKDQWPGGRFTITNVIARRGFLEANKDLVKRFLKAHDDLTAWLNANPEEGAKVVNEGIKRITGKALPPETLRQAWSRVVFTTDPLIETTKEQAKRAHAIGLAKTLPDFSRLLVEGLR
ncbi:MAG: ABC transporter substrate-binding protein [Planctomycetes bacterium]|nr:ABC transporter substrate-binding protein [Planctomycetota bacterium]